MKRCFVLGGGPSLKGFDFSRLKNEVTIGVNFTFKHFEPTYLIWSDIDLYPQHRTKQTSLDGGIGIDDLKNCEKWVQEDVALAPYYDGINKYKRAEVFHGDKGLENGLYGGINGCYLTGILAVSFAIAKGFGPIYLLGYDCKAVDGKFHYHNLSREEDAFSRFTHLYDPFRGQRVFNCCLDSLLPQFPKVHLEEVLANGNGNDSDEGAQRETVKVSCLDTVVNN